jgi:S-adenosylhomocysteine hydrolase
MLAYIEDTEIRGKELIHLCLQDGWHLTSDIEIVDVAYVGVRGIGYETISFKKGSRVYTLLNNEKLKRHCQHLGVMYHCLYEDYSLVQENTYLTTEALLGYMILDNPTSIVHSSVLVIGYGNCGKDIARKLQALQAKITISNRGNKYQKMVLKQGYSFMPLESLELSKYDYVINTVPYPILDKGILNTKKDTCKIYDIASFPYGIKEENRCDMYYILSELPAKYAYKSATILIYKAISKREDVYVKR